MVSETRLALENIIGFCDEKCQEADQTPPSDPPFSDIRIGEKVAYDRVAQFIRARLAEIR
jgi:hypothetical protein